LSFARVSCAECEGLFDQLNKSLGYPESETEGYFAACKVWPADANKTIVALAHFQKGSSYGEPSSWGEGLWDLDMLIVKTDSGEIQHRLFQKGAVSSEAIRFIGIDIDTARYQLAPTTIAFGIRANFGGPADVETLSLYVIQQNKLKPILSKLIMLANYGEDHVECPSWSRATRTLAIAKTVSNGYADLILQEKKVEQDMVDDDTNEISPGCTVEETKSSQRYTLRFDGNTYIVPIKELQY